MTPDTDKREWLGEWIYAKFVQNYEKLLEENKKLKEYNWELIENHKKDIDILCEENKKLNDRVKELIWKIDQLEEENENLSKDLFHLTNNGQRKNQTATQWAEWVIREWGEEQEKNARDS